MPIIDVAPGRRSPNAALPRTVPSAGSGLLSGKYRKGVPPGSRGALESYAFLREGLTDPAKNDAVAQLESFARELSCTLAQLALAWWQIKMSAR